MKNEWDYADIYDGLQDISNEISEFIERLSMHETRDSDTDLKIQEAMRDWRERLSGIDPIIKNAGGRN